VIWSGQNNEQYFYLECIVEGNRQAVCPVHELGIGTAHFTNWEMRLPSSQNGQFHRLGVTYVQHWTPWRRQKGENGCIDACPHAMLSDFRSEKQLGLKF